MTPVMVVMVETVSDETDVVEGFIGAWCAGAGAVDDSTVLLSVEWLMRVRAYI